MEANDLRLELTSQQQRVLKLLFKFRFISAPQLSRVMNISSNGAYQAVEVLVAKRLAIKIYKDTFRIDRKPAYYYLNQRGVTTVRKLLSVNESVVHTLYKNDAASLEFIDHCLVTAECYTALQHSLPANTEIFTKTEINRFTQFPKYRPDLYIRTPEGKEAIIVIMDGKPLFIARKRLDEIIQHSEDGEWDGEYPRIGIILRSLNDKNSFLFTARKKLDAMGMDEGEIHILATHLVAIRSENNHIWSDSFKPKSLARLFE